jgi:hypothetical protein
MLGICLPAPGIDVLVPFAGGHDNGPIIGMRELLPMESIHIRSGKVMVRVGQPIPTKDLKLSDRESPHAEAV